MVGIPYPLGKPVFAKSPPKKLLAISLACVALAAILSTQLMIKLGPMRTSLLSQNDSVRQIAEQEIFVGRILLLLLGVVFFLTWVSWRKLTNSRIVQFIVNHEPVTIPQKHLLNLGFALLVGGTCTVLIWVAFSRYFPSLMADSIVREDGLIQNATAFLFVLSAGYSAHLSVKLQEKRRKIAHLILAVFFVVCVGEELSWGQRILNFETPEMVKAYNTQSEFNLHNSFGYSADHIFIAGVFIFGAIIPIVASRSPIILRLFDMTGLPLASRGLSIGVLFVSSLHNWTVYSFLDSTPLRIAETRELLSALGFLILMFETRRYLRRRKN